MYHVPPPSSIDFIDIPSDSPILASVFGRGRYGGGDDDARVEVSVVDVASNNSFSGGTVSGSSVAASFEDRSEGGGEDDGNGTRIDFNYAKPDVTYYLPTFYYYFDFEVFYFERGDPFGRPKNFISTV